MTKGLKSSEFWLTLAAMGAATFLAHQGISDAVVLGMLGVTGAYSVSRGLAKKNGA